MNIIGKKTILRAIEEKDLDILHKWSNDPEIWNLLGGWHFPTSKNSLIDWFLKLKSDTDNQRFAIEYNGEIIGTLNLLNIDWKNKNAHSGMLIGSSALRGKGIGVDCVFTIMKYAFEELGLKRLNGDIIEYNISSYKLYVNKCGWKQEGVQRDFYFRNNKYWNRIIVGVTIEDYNNIKNKYWEDI